MSKARNREVTVKIGVDVDEGKDWSHEEIELTIPAQAFRAVNWSNIVDVLYQQVNNHLAEVIRESQRKEYAEKYQDDPAG